MSIKNSSCVDNPSQCSDDLQLIIDDPALAPFAGSLEYRVDLYHQRLAEIEGVVGSLDEMSLGYEFFGFNRGEREGVPGVWYREWAPGADALFLIGDLNEWNRQDLPMERDDFGTWSIFLPDAEYANRLIHGSRVKVHVVTGDWSQDRIPAYIERVECEEGTNDYNGIFWMPQEFQWQNENPQPSQCLRIYEAHIGMAQEEEKVGTYKEFTQNILPRVKELGYNALQLMGIMQHPYYGSFGYHVSNFFAASDHFGSPEDLKELIDTAHSMGIVVFLDVVHSHTVKNLNEGLNFFDGTSHHYFHAGGRGEHLAWDSMLFDYGKFEVLRFLLSNIRYWLCEYRFDGFRFDGVTSMMYLDHGLGQAFGDYHRYFDGDNLDFDAITYLQLANTVAHTVRPGCVTIAEDVSGMPGVSRPIEEGGIGFDYRLAMGAPDNWIKLLKEFNDDDWPLQEMFWLLVSRRPKEKVIAYCESHDQAMVGDKTIAFWLMDANMYHDMAVDIDSHVIDRGIALHKMIRIFTYAFGGDGWLNFMGNEFGHPEWIDFPRQGNEFSHKHARRQWSLVDSPFLRYRFLNNFDRAMHQLDDEHSMLSSETKDLLSVHEDDKILIIQRADVVFVFNFHPHNSYEGYRIGVPEKKDYKVALSSDDELFGGCKRISTGTQFPWVDEPCQRQQQHISVYIPTRSVVALVPVR